MSDGSAQKPQNNYIVSLICSQERYGNIFCNFKKKYYVGDPI